MTRAVLYIAAPLRPTEGEIAAMREIEEFRGGPSHGERARQQYDLAVFRCALRANLERAQRWLVWLRKSFPETTFIAPWIAAVLSGADDTDSGQREAGIVDACAVIERCDGIVLVGPRISDGMRREMEHGAKHSDAAHECELSPDHFRVYDLTRGGAEPPGFPPGERPTAKTLADYMEAWAMVLRARSPT